MEIFRQSEVVTRVMASTSDMMERPAERPANSVLASGRETPITLPDWKRGLADYLARREQPEPEEPRPQRAAGSTVPPAGARADPREDEPGDEEEDGGEGERPEPQRDGQEPAA